MAERQSVIRSTRKRHGVGVRELARRCTVSPATVTDWEASEARGTAQIATIERALAAMGESLSVRTGRDYGDWGEDLDRPEQRISRELHRAIATKLIADPSIVLERVPGNVERLRGNVRGPLPISWLTEWADLAATRDIGGLVNVMLGTTQRAIDMRQVSPFAGVLTQPERVEAIERAMAK